MKKIISLTLFLFLSLVSMAQIPNAHMDFLDIPIDGQISDFHKEMKKNGFSLDPLIGKRAKGIYIYKGRYMGEMADVCVNYYVDTKQVYMVNVMINSYVQDKAMDLYKKIQDELIKKYRHDPRAIHYGKLHSAGDGGEFPEHWITETTDLKTKTTVVSLPIEVDNELMGGRIVLSLVPDMQTKKASVSRYYVSIAYLDWANYGE